MQSSLYVALSAQVALQSRLEAIAQNVANTNTVGYRATEMKFDSVLSAIGDAPVSFVSSGDKVIRQIPGDFVKTGNAFDVAVKGAGWLAVSTAAGQTYTRDGRMRMDPSGGLASLRGDPVLDAGGAPIQLDPSLGEPTIYNDGTIMQAGKRTGVLGLFRLDNKAQLTRVDGGILSSIPGTPVVDTAGNGVVQGFTEQSNVNPVTEMARLIYVQRAFDGVSATVQSAEFEPQRRHPDAWVVTGSADARTWRTELFCRVILRGTTLSGGSPNASKQLNPTLWSASGAAWRNSPPAMSASRGCRNSQSSAIGYP